MRMLVQHPGASSRVKQLVLPLVLMKQEVRALAEPQSNLAVDKNHRSKKKMNFNSGNCSLPARAPKGEKNLPFYVFYSSVFFEYFSLVETI